MHKIEESQQSVGYNLEKSSMEVKKRGWDRVCLMILPVQRADFQAHIFCVSGKCSIVHEVSEDTA